MTNFKIKNFIIESIPTLTHGFYTSARGEARSCQNIAKILVDEGYNVYTKAQWLDNCKYEKPTNFMPVTALNKFEKYIHIAWVTQNLIEESLNNVCTILLAFDLTKKFPAIKNKHVFAHQYFTGERAKAWAATVKEKFFVLPHAPIVDINTANNFLNKDLLWTTRGGIKDNGGNAELIYKTLEWVGDKLRRDIEANFYMVSSIEPSSRRNITREILESDIYKKSFKHVYERVHFLNECPYDSLLDIMKKCKIVVNPGVFNHTYAGSTIEAAFIGIPTPQYIEGPLSNVVKDLTMSNSSQITEFVKSLERLYTDYSFYKECSILYKEYVSKNYSKNKFLECLEKIISNCIVG